MPDPEELQQQIETAVEPPVTGQKVPIIWDATPEYQGNELPEPDFAPKPDWWDYGISDTEIAFVELATALEDAGLDDRARQVREMIGQLEDHIAALDTLKE